jgi:hypothetical protein
MDCNRLLAAAMVASGLWMMPGCATKLETGYEPHRLGLSADERKAFYADPFTAGAHPSERPTDTGENSIRPGV